MNNLDKITKQLSRLTAPIRRLGETLQRVIPPYVNSINDRFAPLAQEMNKALIAIQPFVAELNKSVAKIAEYAKKWQEARKQDVTDMAENGWYPNWFTFDYAPEVESVNLDELMCGHLKNSWDDITSMIIELCPNRRHILENAFKLHKSGNYIAAIPLFLAQADGICCEKLKTFLFTGNETEDKVDQLLANGEISPNILTNVFLEPFKLKNHHNAGISKHSYLAKERAPNRHGIIHGHRRHLDYGTKINSLKCFSLLSFIVYSTKELMSETS